MVVTAAPDEAASRVNVELGEVAAIEESTTAELALDAGVDVDRASVELVEKSPVML